MVLVETCPAQWETVLIITSRLAFCREMWFIDFPCTSLPGRWLVIAYLISHQVSYQEGEAPLEVTVDEVPEPSLVSIQRWRDSQEASSSKVLTGDGSISKRAAKDTSQRSEAKTDGQRDRSNRLGTALFMSLGVGGHSVIHSVLKWR